MTQFRPSGSAKALSEEMAYLHESRSIATFVAYYAMCLDKACLTIDAFYQGKLDYLAISSSYPFRQLLLAHEDALLNRCGSSLATRDGLRHKMIG